MYRGFESLFLRFLNNTSMKRILLVLAIVLAAAVSASAQGAGSSNGDFFMFSPEYLVKGNFGYGSSTEFFRGSLVLGAGAYADFNIWRPLWIETGLELKSVGFGKKYDYSGLSGSSTDFYEIYHYRYHYLGIPLLVKLHRPDQMSYTSAEWFAEGLYLGITFNVPLAGSYNWRRVDTGLNDTGSNNKGSGEIKTERLTSPLVSFRFGADSMISEHFGWLMDYELMANLYKTGNNRGKCSTIRIGVIYKF